METDRSAEADEFLYIVQGIAIAAFARSKEKLTKLAGILALANAASNKFPSEQGALCSAIEFCSLYMEGLNWDDDKSGSVSPWLEPFVPRKFGPTEIFIDGKWQLDNPRWEGLPGDRSADLNIMASLREKPGQEVAELVQAGCGSARSIQVRLSRLEKQGYVKKSNDKPARWSLSRKLSA